MKDRYRNDWDRRASDNARGYTASHDHETEEQFAASGARDGSLIFETSGFDPDRKHGSAIEIGCGIGRLMIHMARHFDRVCGADVSPEMIRQAGERMKQAGIHDRTSLLVVDGEGRIPTDEKFDLVYSYTVFQHMRRKDTLRYIAEVRRLLADSGTAVLHFVEPFGLRRNLQALLHIDPPSSDTLHFRYFRRKEVENVCRKNGLRIEAHRKVDVYGLYRIAIDR
ncbi:MAG: SAM-dependent methyltransferase [Planctomycetota bacterium]|jgi:cyclopropane fatty-acyl-phospholipid synthase-like methyltransferase